MLKKLIFGLLAMTFLTSAFAVTVEVGDDWHDWKWRESHREAWDDWRNKHHEDWVEWHRTHAEDYDRWCYYHHGDC